MHYAKITLSPNVHIDWIGIDEATTKSTMQKVGESISGVSKVVQKRSWMMIGWLLCYVMYITCLQEWNLSLQLAESVCKEAWELATQKRFWFWLAGCYVEPTLLMSRLHCWDPAMLSGRISNAVYSQYCTQHEWPPIFCALQANRMLIQQQDPWFFRHPSCIFISLPFETFFARGTPIYLIKVCLLI